jgi:LPXTG-motif cell wall-anchored protein
MSALVAGLALATALSRHGAATQSLAATPIVCAPNSSVSDSGCGNTGTGNSGSGNSGTSNSGDLNNGTGNSGIGNTGTAESGIGNNGTGNSGCGNSGTSNSGGANVGTSLSGGVSCPITVGTTPGGTTTTVKGTTTTVKGTTTTVKKASPPSASKTSSLPVTGTDTTGPLTLAVGLMLSGAAAVGIANKRRHAVAAATGGEPVPLSTAVGLLLTGRAKAAERQNQN